MLNCELSVMNVMMFQPPLSSAVFRRSRNAPRNDHIRDMT